MPETAAAIPAGKAEMYNVQVPDKTVSAGLLDTEGRHTQSRVFERKSL